MKTQPVKKAVIAAAGLGTRFLPQTKAMPKEMLPILDKPILQWVVEDLVAAGVTDVIIVGGAQKRAMEDHFDRSIELEQALINKDKDEAAKQIEDIADMANFVYVRQKGLPPGNARPLLNVSHLVEGEPFFYFEADSMILSEESKAQQLLKAYQETGDTIISLIEIDEKDADKYGMAKIGEKKSNCVYKLDGTVEKPPVNETPSKYMANMCYLVRPDFLDYLDKISPKNGEIWANDAINLQAQDGNVSGCIIEGTHHDTGNPLSYLKTQIHFALSDPSMKEEIREFVNSVE